MLFHDHFDLGAPEENTDEAVDRGQRHAVTPRVMTSSEHTNDLANIQMEDITPEERSDALGTRSYLDNTVML